MNMGHKLPCTLLLGLTGILVGCGANPVVKSTTVSTPAVVPDVYVAGFELNSSGVKVAKVWKNGVETVLSDGSHGAYASSVAVSGNDVYVAGVEYNGKVDVAKVWKNGSPTSLTDGTLEASAKQITVSGTDVYVAGGQFGFDAKSNLINVAGYWKNGIFTALVTAGSHGENGAQITSIVVQGSDVYVAGTQSRMTMTGPSTAVVMPVAMYWKNGLPVVLTDGLHYAQVSSIALAGTDVYVAGGNCVTLDPDCQNATCWKNGVQTVLSTAQPSVASGIAVSGTNVYESGNQSVTGGILAEYWTNGKPATLYQSPVAASNGIVALGSDVYVVGAQLGGACYWKNGVLHSVTGGQYTSTGYGIAVVMP
jgi:hypothetical protein